MSRRILAQVAAPAAITGLLLSVACLTSAWYINRLQADLAGVVTQNVASAKAAQQLEGTARKLRFDCFLYLIEPDAPTFQQVESDELAFDRALRDAADTAQGLRETALIASIKAGYDEYRRQFEILRRTVKPGTPRTDFQALARDSPVDRIVEPCWELLEEHDRRALATAEQTEQMSRYLRLAMLFLGLAAPLGGILSGYGIARGLSRSITRLSVHIKDMAQHLEHDVGSVSVSSDADIHHLDRQLERVVHRVEEVTSRLQRQQRALLRAEQLSTVGKLAANVAHEIRNPMTSVKMLVGLALRQQKPKPLSTDDLRVIHAEVGRVEQTVQHLLDIARVPEPQRQSCDLRAVVAEAAELVRPRAEQQGVTLHVNDPGTCVTGEVDRAQLHSVLINLLFNALDAMPQGGQLAVELSPAPGGAAVLRVTDTGPGIPAAVRDRLFEPFVSTKPTGTGLGLSIVRRIIEEHDGTIGAQNRPEGGACFTIRLPERPNEVRHAHAADR